ncbi:MAG: glycosyltransferase [Clostridiales bacterium]|nr:glycosyltransferase [Clostridiales bacterium]
MATPVVSVIIPVYNVEQYLAQCLDSVLGQTLGSIEVICVDDGSTDSSPAILEQYARQDDRVRVLYQKNQHAGVARNRGLAAAQGDYIIFLDSDDFFDLEMLEKTTLAAREQNADIVLFGGVRYDDATQEVTKRGDFLHRKLLPEASVFSPADVPDTLFALATPAPWCRLYARRFLLKTGLQFQELPNSNDVYFTFSSMALAERITALDADLVYYRINRPASLQQDKHKDPLCFLFAFNAIYQELVRRDLFELLQTSYRHSALSTVLYNLKSVRSDKARLEILEALDAEPYCQLPLQEVPEVDDNNHMVHRYSLQLSAARDWYHRSEKIYNLTEQHRREAKERTSAQERNTVPVSVVIPVYNAAPYLDETLRSIANQTLEEIEIICINDGSTDESLEILERWAAKDIRFEILSQPNSGQGYARNVGVSHAKGKYLYFMDSDDILEQNALEQLVAVAEEKKLDALFFDGSTFYDNEELAESFSRYQSTYMRSCAYDDVYDGPTLLRKFCEEGKCAVSPCLQILRADFIRENNIRFLPGVIYEDNPFTFEVMLKAKRTSHLRYAYFSRRIREGSTVTKTVTFYNAYSYYRCFHAMMQTYFEAASGLTPENRNVALQQATNVLRSSQNNYAMLPPEYECSELGLRENLYAFQILVCNTVKERCRANTLNEKLKKSAAQRANLKQKFATARSERSTQRAQIRELKKQISALKKENKAQAKKMRAMRRSASFRIGKIITWPLRKLKSLLSKLRK